jgi:formylglycine-generating enzyme
MRTLHLNMSRLRSLNCWGTRLKLFATLAILAAGCDTKSEGQPIVADGSASAAWTGSADGATSSSTPTTSSAIPTTSSTRATIIRGKGTYLPAPPGIVEPAVLPKPPTQTFVSNSKFPDCVHPGVQTDCTGGWCKVPAGCFVWGSPESEPGRGANDEIQGPVTISRPFEIQQHETTIEEWQAAKLTFREGPVTISCGETDCPVTNVSWFEVALYANRLSSAHEPPLPACYVLEDCSYAEFGYTCKKVGMTAATAYQCTGYRLPTRAEWQYAARAGTITAYYSGDITVTEEDERQGYPEDPMLNPIAWYAYNSWDEVNQYEITRPVGLKWPNAWGLYDILGNASELLHDADMARSPTFPAIDPFGEIGIAEDGRPYCGGSIIGSPSLQRVASGLQASPGYGADEVGFRLARTLDERAPAQNDAASASSSN